MVISVLVPTLNEQEDLSGCLESVAWSDDIHVYDSYSSDRTGAIAEAAGARISRRPGHDVSAYFGGGEAAHKNWALSNIPFKHPWVLQIDADERVTPELASSIREAVCSEAFAAYRIQRRDFFMGTWLKHVQASPYYIRLFRPEKMHYERLINPVSIVDGPVGELSGYLDHFPFSKGIEHWLRRHNSYSTLEAHQILENRNAGVAFSMVKAFFERDFTQRRFHQKELFYRLPMRPFMKFLILYLGKGGFLDGRAGLTYASLQSIYEYFIQIKLDEIERKHAVTCNDDDLST